MDAAAPAQQSSAYAAVARLRLLLVSDGCFLCQALAATLERDPSVSVVRCSDAAEIAPGLAAVADAVLLFVERPEDIGVVRWLRDAVPGRPVIACGLREAEEDVGAWAETGVTGWIPNTTHLAQFLPLVRRMLSGERFYPPIRPAARRASAWNPRSAERCAETSRKSAGPCAVPGAMPLAGKGTRRSLSAGWFGGKCRGGKDSES